MTDEVKQAVERYKDPSRGYVGQFYDLKHLEDDRKLLADAYLRDHSEAREAERKEATEHLTALLAIVKGDRVNIAVADARRLIALLSPTEEK